VERRELIKIKPRKLMLLLLHSFYGSLLQQLQQLLLASPEH
jgi:hypothetical protein